MKYNELKNKEAYVVKKCDRCGETEFLELINIIDCGFLRKYESEPLPDGWNFHEKTGLLCPKCENEFDGIVEKFMGENIENKQKE